MGSSIFIGAGMNRLLSSISLAWLLTSAGDVLAASFDCGLAATPVEKAICTSPQLERLDTQLGQAYAQARKACPDKNLQIAQRSWLRDRRNRCADEPCLISAYQARLAALQTRSCNAPPQACTVRPERLLGNWRLISEGGPFEEMAFAENTFNSWLHQRPELAGAHWRMDGCRLTIQPGEGEPDSRLTLLQLKDDQLSLREDGDQDTAIYRRIR